MDFEQPTPATRPEAILPMINLVFLMLIFFLMTAQIAPPERIAVTEPRVRADETIDPAAPRLFLRADGALAFGDARGEAAIPALAAALQGVETAVTLHADRAASAAAVARALSDLGGIGARAVSLVVEDVP